MYFLLFLHLLSFSSSFEIAPRIIIQWYGYSIANASTLCANEPFEIQVYTKYDIKYEITCFDYNTGDLLLETKLSKCKEKETCYFTYSEATPAMSTKWNCAFVFYNNNYMYYITPFDVIVQSYPVILYINNQQRISRRDPKTSYDHDVNYTYVDGEMAYFKCETPLVNGNEIKMIFLDKDHQIEIPGEGKISTVYLKLDKHREPRYLDCIKKPLDEKSNFYVKNTLRVHFLPGTLDYPTFKINDLVLTHNSVSTRSEEIKFSYDFYENERVEVETVIDKNLFDNSLECRTHNTMVPEEINELKTGKWVKNLKLQFTLEEKYNHLLLTCNVMKNGSKIRISLEFKYKSVPDASRPKLYGVSWANILASYDWKQSNTLIEYSYRKHDLILNCTSEDNGMNWSFNSNQVESRTLLNETYSTQIKGFIMTQSFKMKPNWNRAVISCYKDYHGSTKIILIRDKQSLSDGTDTSTDSVMAADTDSQSADDDEEKTNTSNWEIFLIIGIVTLVAIVTAFAGCLLFKNYQRNKQGRENQNILNYENLPEHNEGPMAIPRQWEMNDEAKAKPDEATPYQINTENLYAKPLPKSQRHKNDNIYSDVINYRPEPTYSNTGKEHSNTGKEHSNTGKEHSNTGKEHSNTGKENSNNGKEYSNIGKEYSNTGELNNKDDIVNAEICYANISTSPIFPTYTEVLHKSEGEVPDNVRKYNKYFIKDYEEPAYAEISKSN